jgi:Fur family peroxide stress response transcriptional regulator
LSPSEAVVRERKRTFETALRTDGMRMTHQRLEVIAELASADTHPSVDDVFRAVRARVPSISVDTVYRTLATLADKGLIERLPVVGPARFDPDAEAHHHFMCTRCGRMEDVDPAAMPPIRVPDALLGIGVVEAARLELRGLCDACASHGGS